MTIIDGQKIADELLAALKEKTGTLPAGRREKKFLAGFFIGGDAASRSFQELKKKTGEALGVDYRFYELPEDSTNDSAREAVGKVARGSTCGGVIVQLPLPPHLNRHYILNAIPPEKDPDVIGERALGTFYTGRSRVLPPAVETLREILLRFLPVAREEGAERECFLPPALRSLPIAVVGPGFLVGRPIAVWLMNNHVHNLAIIGRGGDFSTLKQADLVILGAGSPGLVKPEMLKPGAAVVDFSYTKVDGKLVGDLDASPAHSSSLSSLTFFTPTPGGTGPILVAKLFENFYALNA